MFTEIQIRAIVDSKVKILKEAESKKELPEYTEVYQESVEFFERLSIHSEIGKFPEKLFKMRAPNQTEPEFDYIKGTYKTTTFPIWTRFIGVLNRIWNDQNWSITWPEVEDISIGEDTPKKYMEEEYPVFGSIENYFKSIVTPTKERDANAVLCHKPYYIPSKINEDNELVVDQTQTVKVIAYIYGAAQVVGYLDGEYALIELKEKSEVKVGNGTKKEGLVYEFYDRDNIYRIVQVGVKKDYIFDIFLYWPHGLGYLPVQKLKGKPIQKETDVLYQSDFMSAVEPMDDILLDSSYLRTIKAGHAFPHKWEYVDDCEYNHEGSECRSGYIQIDKGEGGFETVKCPNCHGTGKAKSSSPLGVYQVKAPNQNANGGSENMQIPPFGWVAPDPAIMEFLRKEIGINENTALSILNLYVSNSEVKGSETALKSQIDREEMFSFIKSISSQLFDLYGFSHKCILQMMFGKNISLPAISEPKNFSFRTDADLTEEIARAKEIGLPDIAIRALLIEYLNTRFNNQNEITSKVVDLAFAVDRLVFLSTTEIAQKKLSGSIANYEDILHTSVYMFIAELLNEDDKFFEKDIEEQKRLLIEKAKAKDIEIAPKKMDANTILTNANAN